MPVKLAAVLLITAACLGWVLWGLDPEKVRAALVGARWWLLGPAIAVYWLSHGLRTWRYQLLVGEHEGERVPFWQMFSICGVGFLAIHVVPFRLGELVRPYLVTEQRGIPFGKSLGAVVVERLLDFLMLLGLLLIVAFGLTLPAGAIEVGGVDIVAAGQKVVGVALAAGSLFLGALWGFGQPAAALAGRLLSWVPVVGPRLPAFLSAFADAPRQIFSSPATGAALLGTSVGVWVLTVIAVWFTLLAFDGVPHTLTAATVTWTAAISGSVAVPTPGFFGPFEAFCLAALMLWDVDPDAGRTFALMLHLSQFFFTIALGGYFLVKQGLSLRALVSASQRASAGEAAP